MIIWHKVHKFLNAHKLELLLAVIAAVYFYVSYVSDPSRPELSETGGWLGFFDQSSYVKQAIASAGRSLGDYYVYGPVYPLVAVPFVLLGLPANNAFTLFDLLAFVLIGLAVFRYATAIKNQLFGFICALALLLASPLVHYMVTPWNSTIVIVSIAIVLWVASLKSAKISTIPLLFLALACALAFGARYIDVIWLVMISSVLVFQRGGFRKVVMLGVATAVLCVPVFWTHYAVFGSILKTPYTLHVGIDDTKLTTDQDAGAYSLRRVPNAAYGMFVSPIMAGDKTGARGLLISAPWFIFALLAPFNLRYIDRKHRVFLMTLLGVALLSTLFYLSFRASGPGAVKFGTLHYFKAFWPVITICAMISLGNMFEKLSVVEKSKHASKK